MFFVCAAFDVFGAIVFAMFGSGSIEPWAMDEQKNLDIVMDISKPSDNDE